MKRSLLTLVSVAIVVAILAVVLHMLRPSTESFEDAPLDAMKPDEFAFHLVQSVKGPIQRLSSTLLDIPTWKERIQLARMNPVELARHQLRKQSPQ